LFAELAAEGNDVSHVGDPCLIEKLGCVRALSDHDFAPVSAKMVKYGFDGAVGVPKVLLVEFFDVLLFDTVDDLLHPNVGDHLL
jgi:hypothetical protein